MNFGLGRKCRGAGVGYETLIQHFRKKGASDDVLHLGGAEQKWPQVRFGLCENLRLSVA
ncbi:hypothetical protein D3C86_2129260 [compost metagenome]